MPIQIPEKKQGGSLGKIGAAVGAVAGAIYGGGAPGALKGAQMGGAVGGAADGLFSGAKGTPPQVGGGAMERRLQTPAAAQPGGSIAQAQEALASMPPAYQKQYGPTLTRARQYEDQGGYTA